jgi:superfamily I DNA/RNA helicase
MLTPQQQAIVEWCENGSGHAVVIARAGTGKTFVLKQCITALQNQGVGDMVVCAYNRAIADEIKDDIVNELGITDWKVAEANTVHSFALRAWRKVSKDVKIDGNKVVQIVRDEADNFSNEDIGFPRYVLKDLSDGIVKAVSLAKNACIGINTGIDDRSKWYDLIDHYAIHESEEYPVETLVDCCIFVLKRSIEMNRDMIDFDDMIYAPLYHRAKIWPKRFVMVDEAQDLSPLRQLFAYALAGKSGRLVFVGDDRQAIYGFSGADTDSLAKIEQHLQAKRLYLTSTFRCGKAIVEKAKELVPDYEAAESNHQGRVISPEYWPEDMGPGDAVISRKNADLISLAYKRFLSKGIGCKVEGRDIGNGLKRLAKRWKRVKTIAALYQQLDAHLDRETTKWLARDKPERLEAVQDQVETLQVIMARCIDMDLGTVDDVCAEIDRMFADNVGDRGDVLTLTTAHKSKGREWDRVVLFKHGEIGSSPWDRREWQFLQSSNLMYVAITRAKETLVYL